MPSRPKPTDLTTQIATFRRFNRMYTRYIGTLNEGLLNTAFSLAEARILYELAARTPPRASEIAESLGIDPGYLSRILAKFQRAGLLHRKPSKQDARFAELKLTPRGRSAFQKLNTRSDQQARTALKALAPAACTELIRSMTTIEAILTPPKPTNSTPPTPAAPFTLRSHRVGDMGWVVHREAAGYAEQYAFDQTFEALVAKIVSDFITHFNPARERCWIAEIDGRNVGHIFLVQHPRQRHTAKLRLLFVEASARGLGLGDALVGECIRFARAAGYRRIVLWTQSMLTPAIRIYRKAGFRLIKEEPHQSFGHNLIGQEWELILA
jgi:DNA-binding MarR family transcriptional regulator/GNAT superfamily N-acetyltransferase